jgi:hypothetical protein
MAKTLRRNLQAKIYGRRRRGCDHNLSPSWKGLAFGVMLGEAGLGKVSHGFPIKTCSEQKPEQA